MNTLLAERIPPDVMLRQEGEDIVDVICKKCRQQIGRLQTIPAEKGADEEEIYAEIRLIADEHRLLCRDETREDVAG